MVNSEDSARRPIKARQTNWADSIARRLAGYGLKPNHISLLSVVFAAAAGLCIIFTPKVSMAVSAVLFIISAIAIQMRLLCNLFDGMVAVECGLKTQSGEIFNDLPDRIADPIILISIGYAIPSIQFASEVAWLAGILAVLTAYVRVLGSSAGTPHYFLGPMAKQHRMAIVTVALIVSAITVHRQWHQQILFVTLIIIALGCLLTIVRRTYKIIHQLEG